MKSPASRGDVFRYSFLLALVALGAALPSGCASRPAVATPPAPEPSLGDVAVLLRLEDRREFDGTVLDAAARDPRTAQRTRAALAIGRIADPRGAELLRALVADADAAVRAAACFAAGELESKALVGPLTERLADADAAVAGLAAEALGKIGDPAAISRLATVLPGAPPPLRDLALVSLFRYKSPEALALALPFLDDADPEARWRAVFTLNRFPHESSRPALRRALEDEHPLARAFAARGLGGILDLADLEPLVRHLGDPDPQVRVSVVRAIAAILEKHDASSGATLAARVLALAGDAEPGVRLTAIEALGRFCAHEMVRQRLVEIAAGAPGKAANLALRALAVGEAPEALPLALPASADPERYRRVAAAQALGALGGGQALQRLSELLDDREAMVRGAAAEALPDEHLAAAAGHLGHVLGAESDPIVRATIVDRLASRKGLAGEEVFRSALERARADRDNDAQLSSVRALQTFPTATARAALESALAQSGDFLVRRAARQALIAGHGVGEESLAPIVQETALDARAYEGILAWAARPHFAVITTTAGTVRLRLRSDVAPMTTWNFWSLARRGYYDGLRWHRVVPNFVVQDGDPRGDGSGGPGYQIRDEINPLRYRRGTVGMALSGPDTGGSQYFICHAPQPHLDGGYTVFAEVVEGLEVVDRIVEGDAIVRVVAD